MNIDRTYPQLDKSADTTPVGTIPTCQFGGGYKYLIIRYLTIISTLVSCDTTEHSPTLPTTYDLRGDWHILSALKPTDSQQYVDIAWDGSMLEFTPDSVRLHRHDLAYPQTYPGETVDVTLSIEPYSIAGDRLYVAHHPPYIIKPAPHNRQVTLDPTDAQGVRIVIEKK